MVYLDNNATTPVHPEVKNAFCKALDVYGNASSMHQMGQKSHHEVEMARQAIAYSIGAIPKEILFTSSGTEANNTVIHNAFWNSFKQSANNTRNKKPHIITTAIEHPSMLRTLDYYQKKGLEVTYIPVDQGGIIDPNNIKMNIRENTSLISVMYANNEIGVIQPIEKIAEMAREYDVLFHTDAVQAYGKLPFNVQNMNINMATLSGHKIYAPKGIAALYIKEGTPLMPFIYGGHQEANRRAGTENIPGILAMGKAAEMIAQNGKAEINRIEILKNKLKIGLQERISHISINGSQEYCLPNTLNVTFKYVEGESILLYADFEEIALSTGSACSTGSLEPSHVIMALGVDAEHAHGSVRFSLGRENTEKDIDYVLDKFPPIIEKLRKMSPLYVD